MLASGYTLFDIVLQSTVTLYPGSDFRDFTDVMDIRAWS